MQGRRLKDGSEAEIGLCLPSLYLEIQRLTSTHCIAQSLSDGLQVPLKVPSGFVRERKKNFDPTNTRAAEFDDIFFCKVQDRESRSAQWIGSAWWQKLEIPLNFFFLNLTHCKYLLHGALKKVELGRVSTVVALNSFHTSFCPTAQQGELGW